jgi:hypothetical protein
MGRRGLSPMNISLQILLIVLFAAALAVLAFAAATIVSLG